MLGSVVSPSAAMYLMPVNEADEVKKPPNSPGFARLVALWQSVHSLSPGVYTSGFSNAVQSVAMSVS